MSSMETSENNVGTRRAVSPVACRAVGTSIIIEVGKLPVWSVTVSRSVLVAGCRAVGTCSGESVPQSCLVGCASSLPGYWCGHSN